MPNGRIRRDAEYMEQLSEYSLEPTSFNTNGSSNLFKTIFKALIAFLISYSNRPQHYNKDIQLQNKKIKSIVDGILNFLV